MATRITALTCTPCCEPGRWGTTPQPRCQCMPCQTVDRVLALDGPGTLQGASAVRIFIAGGRFEVGLFRGRPKAPLVLTDEELQTLQRWTRRSKTSQALALRAKIVLACADGATNQQVAEQLGIWPQTVGKWRGRFVAKRLAGLSDEDRPGRPRTIADEQVEAVIVKTWRSHRPTTTRTGRRGRWPVPRG
jgi:hypothetical protein